MNGDCVNVKDANLDLCFGRAFVSAVDPGEILGDRRGFLVSAGCCSGFFKHNLTSTVFKYCQQQPHEHILHGAHIPGDNILYKLLSYPKKTFTRQQLMDEFWDADTNTAPRAVDVYMTKLRSKLTDCEDFEIKTVHGLGYKAVIK